MNSEKLTNKKKGFTLIEVLISITLLSLVLMALYKSTEILRASNQNLFNHLDRASDALKGSKVLYMDLLQAENNISINSKKKFHHLIIDNCKNSLYGLNKSRVTWIVHKEKNTLLRVEGNSYSLPLKSEDTVGVDPIVEGIELFKIYKNKEENKLLVLIKSSAQNIQTFMVQNLQEPPPKPQLVNPTTLGRTKQKQPQK